jgi:hypothetical protein
MLIRAVLTILLFCSFQMAKLPKIIETNKLKKNLPPLSILTSKSPKKIVEKKIDTCIDLSFDTVKILKMASKYIELEFTIRNHGTVPAPIFGKKRGKSDNIAVHFYFSGTNRMTRGALFVDGIYLTKGLKTTKGMLAPNAIYTERLKLSLKKRISFYGVILLQLDAFDILRQECDETNNVHSITPRWY